MNSHIIAHLLQQSILDRAACLNDVPSYVPDADFEKSLSPIVLQTWLQDLMRLGGYPALFEIGRHVSSLPQSPGSQLLAQLKNADDLLYRWNILNGEGSRHYQNYLVFRDSNSFKLKFLRDIKAPLLTLEEKLVLCGWLIGHLREAGYRDITVSVPTRNGDEVPLVEGDVVIPVNLTPKLVFESLYVTWHGHNGAGHRDVGNELSAEAIARSADTFLRFARKFYKAPESRRIVKAWASGRCLFRLTLGAAATRLAVYQVEPAQRILHAG